MKENNLPKILDIGGIEYIQKAEYDKAKKDVDNVKQLVSASIAGLNDFLGAQLPNQSIPQKIEQETKKEVKHEDVYSQRSKHLKIRVSGQRKYKILRMSEDGHFYAFPNVELVFDVRDVIEINKRYNSSTTKKDVKKIARDCQLPVDIVHRIIYNLDIGVLKPYIKEYLSSVNNIKIKAKKIETQNNPQKRKEAGIYS